MPGHKLTRRRDSPFTTTRLVNWNTRGPFVVDRTTCPGSVGLFRIRLMRVWLRNAFVQVSDIDFEFRVTFKNLKSQPLHAMRRFLLAGLCAYVWESNSADEAEEDASLVVEPPLSQEDAELLQEAVEGSSLHCAEELPPASTDSEDEMRESDESDELLASPSAFRASSLPGRV